jgi:hypothetical protein
VHPAGGIERLGEVIGRIGRLVARVAEHRLSYADMPGIVDRQLRGRELAEKVRVEGAAEFPPRDRVDDPVEVLRPQRSPGSSQKPESMAAAP